MPSIRLAARQGRWLRNAIVTVIAAVSLAPGVRLCADDAHATAAADLLGEVPARGSLFICGGGIIPEGVLKRFVDLAGGDKARVAVITTASIIADSPDVESRLSVWKNFRTAGLTFLHTRSRETADDPSFLKPLTDATGVWFIGGNQDRLTAAYLGTGVEKAVRGVLERGGVVGGTSAGAAIMSPLMIVGGKTKAETAPGFGFLPGTVIDQHFVKRNREDRLLGVLAENPELVGLGIDEGCSVIVQGRKITVVDECISESDSPVRVCFAPLGDRPADTRMLKPGDEADVVAWRRIAASRIKPRPESTGQAVAGPLSKGTLVLVGGGKVPAEAVERFIRAAGGPESPLVVVTTAAGEVPPDEAEATGWLTAAGARQVLRVHARTPAEVDNPTVLERLKQAGGVWFTGGRQWRLVDAFFDTAAEKLLRELLERGGAIGGSAAGASIQASYLVRGSPLSNKPMMAEGYEAGFGFLPGAAVDPFFTSRNRFADMASLKAAHPELMGLGIDEDTALVVQGDDMEIIGEHHVCVYGRQDPQVERQSKFELLYAGDRYDLREHKRVGPERPAAVELADRATRANEEASESSAESADPQPQPPLVCE